MSIDIGYLVIVLIVVLFSMTLHEMMHAFTGYWLGDDTAKSQGRVSLNPLRHIDPFLTLVLPLFLAAVGGPIFGGAKPVPFNPSKVKGGEWGAALVAIAGPLTNLVLAFIFFGIGVLLGTITQDGIFVTSGVGIFILVGISVNLGFFAFNILPVPPLDGSRVLYALAPDFFRRIMEVVEQFGIFFIFILVVLLSGPIGSIMGSVIESIMSLFYAIFQLVL